MGIEDAIPVVGWGLLRLPKEKRRLERIEAEAREMFGVAHEARSERSVPSEEAKASKSEVIEYGADSSASTEPDQPSVSVEPFTHNVNMPPVVESAFSQYLDLTGEHRSQLAWLSLLPGRGGAGSSSGLIEAAVRSASSVSGESRRTASTTSRSAERFNKYALGHRPSSGEEASAHDQAEASETAGHSADLDTEASRAQLRRAVDNHPDDFDAMRRLADLEEEKNNFGDAVDLRGRIARGTSDPADYVELARVKWELDDPQDAESAVDLAYEIARDSTTVADVADAFVQVGALEKARSAYRRARELDTESAKVVRRAATFEMGAGNFKDAEELLKQALAREPLDGEVLSEYAVLAEQDLTDRSKARQLYEQAIKAPDVEARVLRNFAEFLGGEQEYDRAIELYERSLGKDDGDVLTYRWYSRTLEQRDDEDDGYEDALAVVERGLQKVGESPLLLVEAGWLYLLRKDEPAEALNQFLAAQRQDPQNFQAFVGAALSYDDLDRPEEARESYRKAAEISPADANLISMQIQFERKQGLSKRELDKLYRRGLDVAPSVDLYLQYAAFLDFDVDDAVGAERVLRGMLADEDYKDDVSVQRVFASFLKAHGKKSEARDLYDKLLDQDRRPSTLSAASALHLDAAATASKGLALAEEAAESSSKLIYKVRLIVARYQIDRDLSEATKSLDDILERDVDSPSRLVIANFFFDTSKFDKAIEQFTRLQDEEPSQFISGMLAAAQRLMGDYEGGLQTARAALARDELDTVARTVVAVEFEGPENGASAAMKLLDDGLALVPEDARLLAGKGAIAFQVLDEIPSAIRYFERAVEADSENGAIWANFAQVLFVEGDDLRAAEIVARLLAMPSIRFDVRLELEFYWFAHVERGAGRAEVAIRSMLKSGVRSPGWPLRANVERALANSHRSPDLLRRLAEVISGGADIGSLREFSGWEDVQE